MSKEVNKRVTIWVNGKEIENNVKSIRAEMYKLTNQLGKMTIGSEEYNKTAGELRKLKAIYDEHCKSLKVTGNEIASNTNKLKDNIVAAGGAAAAAQGVVRVYQHFVATIQEYVDAYATLDDAMSAVQKTTGMTREEVEGLHKSLKSIDTRTSTNELLKIAEIGGRMGIAKDQIQGFTEAVNKANVALGDSFQGGAEEISSILGKISLAYKETRSQEIGKSLTQIGSALNEVGASANATEGNIAAFVQRVGSMPEVFRPTVQQAVALGAAFEESSIDAEVASRAFGIFMMKASTNVEKFATAMHRPVEEVRELINTNPAQFFVEFAESLKGLSATEEGSVLKDLKLNADGVNKIIGAMSTNTERFTEILNTSNTAFAEAVSLDKEYAVVNENAAAQLEKAKKAVEDAKAALGEELMPVITMVTKGTASGIKVVMEIIKWGMQHKAIVGGLTVAYAALFVAKNKKLILDKKDAVQMKIHNTLKQLAIKNAVKKKVALVEERAATEAKTLAEMKARLETMKGVAADNQLRAVLKQETVVKIANAAATRAQAQAQNLLNKTSRSTPWGLIAAGITAATLIITRLVEKTRESSKAFREFNKEVGVQIGQAKRLFDRLGELKKGTAEYNEVQKEILDTYPDLLRDQVDENGNILNLKEAYDQLSKSIRNKIAVEKQNEELDKLTADYMDNQIDYFNKLDKSLDNLSGKQKERVHQRIQELADEGKSASQIIDQINKEFSLKLKQSQKENVPTGQVAGFANTGVELSNEYNAIENIVEKTKNLADATQAVKDKYSPFIHDVKGELDEIAQIDAQIAELQKQIYGAENRKDIRQQIEDLKKLKQQKLENKKADSGNSPGSSEDTDPEEAERKRKKILQDRDAFEKKLAQMRTKEQTDLLTGWEKTRQQIIDKYKEMEDEAVKLYGENSQMLKDVQAQRDQAIVESGQKYVQDMAKVISKSADEIKKWEKELGKDGSNEIIDAVLGVKDKWEQRAADVEKTLKDLESTREVMSEDKMDTTAIDKQIADLKRYREDIMNLSVQEISKTYQKYEKQTADFITAESKAAREATMTEVEKQKAAIQERYQLEIDNINNLIAAKLQNEVLDEAEIQSLRDKIELLKKMQAEAEAAVVKQASGGLRGKSIWQQLAEFDWRNLATNWRQGLELMNDALNEFASSAMSIFNTINQVQSNREQAEFDSYCKMQDNKAKNLQDRLDKGLISQEKYDAEIAKMEEEKEAKEKQMKHEQFERERQSSLAEVLIQGGLAVARAFADYGWPWGLIPAALSTAQTAVQTAMISSQVNPYARGGYIDREQLALMGEEGQEWVASNKLLTDKKTAPVISALERYQRGDIKALDMLRVPEPSWEKLSQSSQKLSRTFASSTPVNNYYYTNSNNTTTSDNSELLAVMKRMDAYLRDPKNRQAVISRKMQLEFDRMETEIKQLARL